MKSHSRSGQGHDAGESRVSREMALFQLFKKPETWGLGNDTETGLKKAVQDWRCGKDRTKTTHVLLLMCLNVGIDPPDVLRVEPCAKLECWTDPLLAQSKMLTKGSEVIGELLSEQYKSLQRNVICKPGLELSVEDLKYNLQAIRKKAKDSRVLIHYNGHGVPRVTQFGELWFFDPDHTKYIPITITDIMGCVGSPAIYVLDCSNAGAILHYWYKHNFHQSRKKDILICACRRHEDLPLNPVLPADLLTSCLTTPIRASLEWYYHYSQRECLLPNVTKEMIQAVPGVAADRKTPLGELNWIFTAVTDAIAWCTLPRDLFHRLFRPRNDMLLVALFRNFLLADRIMRETGCTPLTHPPLPETHTHPMWESWELALEGILSQLPKMLNPDLTVNLAYSYKPATFFSEQLTAFEIWIEFGCKASPTPDQLPCIIQGLSSHQYRVRSLRLLARYLDLGSWAVLDALSCGVMPYLCRLLHQTDLVNYMVVIWTKILIVDPSELTLFDLIRPQTPPARKFLRVLCPALDCTTEPGIEPVTNIEKGCEPQPFMDGTKIEQCKSMVCFILSVLMVGCKHEAQVHFWNWGVLPPLLECLTSSNAQLQAWSCICLAKLVKDIPVAMEHCLIGREVHINVLKPLLSDASQQVRAAACYCLSQLVGLGATKKHSSYLYTDVTILGYFLQVADDPSPLVREEVLHALACYFVAYKIPPSAGELRGKEGLLQKPDTKSLLHADNPTTNYQSLGKEHQLPLLQAPSRDMQGEDLLQYGEGEGDDVDLVDLQIRLIADVAEMLAKMGADSYPLLDAKIRQMVKTLSNSEDPPQSRLFNIMQCQLEKPLFRVEEPVSSLEKRKFREQLNKDTLQTYLNRASEKSFLPSLSGPAEKVPKESIQVTPVFNSAAPIISSNFRAFTQQAVFADAANKISLVDIGNGSVLSQTQHPVESKMTHTFLMNEGADVVSLLVTDASGGISVYSGPGQGGKGPMHLDTAFSASRDPKRVCADWQPSGHALVYSGDAMKVSIFSMEEERLQQCISLPARAVGLNALRTDDAGSRSIAGGFEDGSVRYWDARSGDAHHLFAWFLSTGPHDPVVDLYMRMTSHHLYSMHKSGAIKVWDLRSARTECRNIDAYKSKSLTFGHLHHTYPLFFCGYAGGNQSGKVEILSTRNELLGEAALPKLATAATCFHPYQSAMLVDKYLFSF
eukprot:TRINITY_DN2512_c0_g1_i1.p1 TRINITY_DN2512_c0_g1~~TRINITY_DN2512_c0_g1_i1.p1  ORF type:complete len:1224 (+),score=270.97 TRINITY_DN2512_c0_g1_i1:95-3673(+)